MIEKHFSALTHRDFRIFWLGQVVSLIGTWMQTISLPWLALTLTDSPFLLGLIGALQFTPMIFFSLFAGVLSDRFNRRKIIIVTQTTLAVGAFILAVLVFTKTVHYYHMVILATIFGLANSIDMPVRQSFIIEMVGKEDLMNAIALNSAVFNTARIIGPAIAGLIMGLFGIAYCFLINAVSFVPVIIGLFFIRPQHISNHKSNNKVLKDITEGIKYIFTETILMKTLIVVLIVGIFAMNFNVLVPLLAKKVYNLNESNFGFLMSCIGIGSLIGALLVAVKSKNGPFVFILKYTPFLISIVFIATGLCNIIFVAAFLLVLMGLGNSIFFTTANSTLQLNAKDQFRGRVISVYTLFFAGTTPFGNLFAGSISHIFGVKIGFILSGLMILFLIFVLYLMIKIRRFIKIL
jgi:MFS family permease